MRIRALHVLVLSLGAALVGCDAGEGTNDNPADGTVHDGSDGTNPDDETNGIAMTSPHSANFEMDRVITDGEPGEIICTDTTECAFNEELASGQTFEATIHVDGYISATQQITEGDSWIDWSGTGMLAVEFDGWCNLDGDGVNLYTTTVEDEAGNEWTVLMGTFAGDAVIVTDTTLSGSYNEATFSGDIDTNTGTVTFTYTVDGVDTTLTYANCTE